LLPLDLNCRIISVIQIGSVTILTTNSSDPRIPHSNVSDYSIYHNHKEKKTTPEKKQT